MADWPERMKVVDRHEAAEHLTTSTRYASYNRRSDVSIIVAHQCIDRLRRGWVAGCVGTERICWWTYPRGGRNDERMTYQEAQTMGLIKPDR